jgi:two-component system sensor histidine kinase MprB
VSLRSRLAILFGLLALGVSAIVGAASYQATRSEVSESTDRFLERRAIEVTQGIREQPGNPRPRPDRNNDNNDDVAAADDAGAQLLRLPFDPDAVVQVTDEDGVVLSSSSAELPITSAVEQLIDQRPRLDESAPNRYDDVEIDGTSYRMYTRALPGGGAIQVARSTTENDAVLRVLVSRIGIIGLIAAVLAAFAGWWIARRTTRPLRRLADVAATVADTRDFSVDVPVGRQDEIGKLARSFREMLTALETSRDQQHRLVLDAGHELRTPLTSLRANVEMLQRIDSRPEATLTPEDRRELLQAINAEVGELSNLFTELMELATDSHDADAPMAPVDLADVVSRSVERWQGRVDREISLAAESAMVSGNEAMIERAVTNLLGNADKFSPPGEPIDVVVRAGFVSVRDRGPGIPVADRARVFDRFYRADATRTMPGSGLGLAIVAQIVERHGGETWVTESEHGGADVGFRLPTI